MDLIYGIVGILCLGLLIQGYYKWKKERLDCKFLEELLCFVQKIQHFYAVRKMVDESVCDAMNETEGVMLKEAQGLYQLLDEQQEKTRRHYMEHQNNRFLKILAAVLCIESYYGSLNLSQDGIFQKNLRFIKQEITLELRTKQQIKALFTGLWLLILFPAFGLKIIENWGISNIPELIRYYHGAYGLLCIGAFCLIIYGTHWMVWQLRNMEVALPVRHKMLEWLENIEWIKVFFDRMERKNYSAFLRKRKQLKQAGERLSPRQFQIRQILWAMGSGAVIFMFGLSILEVERAEALNNSGIWSPQIVQNVKISEEQWKNGIQTLSQKYHKKEMKPSLYKRIEMDMNEVFQAKSKRVAETATDQVIENIKTYQEIRVNVFLFLFMIMGALLGWNIPRCLLVYRKQIRKMGAQNEILHYETILLMLTESQIAKEIEMVEWMEEGSILFRDSLTNCLLKLYGGEQKALYELRDAEPSDDFKRLIENLIVSDKTGIKVAFEGLEQERQNRQDKKKQNNEIQVRKRAVLAQMIAFIPLISIIGLYLIIPFVMESMAQLSIFIEQMKY